MRLWICQLKRKPQIQIKVVTAQRRGESISVVVNRERAITAKLLPQMRSTILASEMKTEITHVEKKRIQLAINGGFRNKVSSAKVVSNNVFSPLVTANYWIPIVESLVQQIPDFKREESLSGTSSEGWIENQQ